jgi:predicted transcriptional regulator
VTDPTHRKLSRRERQIMDVVYRRGQATAAEVRDEIPDPPSYSAVRALLRVLEEKGFLKHRVDGQKYVFSPIVPRDRARRSALQHLVQTMFDDSTTDVVATLLDLSRKPLKHDDLDRLEKLIEKARKKGL